MSEGSIVAQVIERYGSYSGTLERRFTVEQQKPAPPRQVAGVPPPRVLSISEELLAFFREQDGHRRGWSQVLLADAVGRTRNGIHAALMELVKSGLVEALGVRQDSKYGARVLYRLTGTQDQQKGAA